MSDDTEGSDQRGRRPDGSAPAADLTEVAGVDPQLAPYGRVGRRVRGDNEVRWAIRHDGSRVGEIVALLSAAYEPRPITGPQRSSRTPLRPDGHPYGAELFAEGIADAFPDDVDIDWAAWAEIEQKLVRELRRGNRIALYSRAEPDPSTGRARLQLRIESLDPQTGHIAQYPYASLSQVAAQPNLSPASTPYVRASGTPDRNPVTQAPPTTPDPREAPTHQIPSEQQSTGWWSGDPTRPIAPPSSATPTGRPQQFPPPQTPQMPQMPPPAMPPGAQPMPLGSHPQPPLTSPGGQPPAMPAGSQPGPVVVGYGGVPPGGVYGQVPVVDQARLQREAFARGVLGTAFGVLAPEAIPLRDGGMRLGDDVVDAPTLDRMTAQLAERAEQGASDPRLLAEAVAMLGDDIAQRHGESPADGATHALDVLLDVPLLPEQNRIEAEAVLRQVLDSTSEPRPTGGEPPSMSAAQAAAREIARDARVLDAVRTPPGPQAPGRHRRQVGGRHVHADRTVGVPSLSAAGRNRNTPELGIGEALDAVGGLRAADFAGRIQRDPERRGLVAVVGTEEFGEQHFRVEIGRPGLRRAAAVDVRSGTAADPHVVRMPPRLAGAQLGRVWTHAISHTLQDKQAQRAGSTGFLDRVRDRLSGATRNRTTTAQYDEFRLLSRNWSEANAEFAQWGMAQSAARRDEVGRQLQGLSAALVRQGQPEPVPPWEASRVSVNAVPRPQVAPGSASHSGIAHLRHRVVAEVNRLEASAVYFTTTAEEMTEAAADAGRTAATTRTEAATEAALLDSGAAERARRLYEEATTSDASRERYTHTAAVYTDAATRAQEAATAYRSVLTELDAVSADPRRPLDQLRSATIDAELRVLSVKRRHEDALVPEHALSTGVVVGRVPHVNAATRRMNEYLAAHGRPAAMAAERNHLDLRSNIGEVLGDGYVMAAGGPASPAEDLSQFMVRIRTSDRYDSTSRQSPHHEFIVGQLDQRNHTVSTTITRSRGVHGRFGLRGLLQAIPGATWVNTVAQALALVNPRVEAGGRRASSVTSTSAANGRRGAVQDVRGPAVANSAKAVLEVYYRRTPFESFRQIAAIDGSGPDDAQDLTMRLSHAHTMPAATETTDLVREGVADQRVAAMPEHMASRVTKMNEICDEAAGRFTKMFGGMDSAAYGGLRSVINEWPGRLDEASVPGGFARTLMHEGRPVALVRAESFLVWDEVELDGESSADHWNERVRVSIATTGIGQTVNTSTDRAAGIGHDFGDVGPTGALIGPSGSVTRSRSTEEGMSVQASKYEVGVERVKRTQGYKARMAHQLTVHELGSQESFQVERNGEVVFRMGEKDAFYYGLPVDRDAVLRGADDKALTMPDGRLRLRADAEPAGPDVRVPGFLGTGEGRIRGKGVGQVPLVTGIDEAATLRALEADGWVPPLDDDFQAKVGELAPDYDRELLTTQLDNLERVKQGISRMRAGTTYDQATQGGVTVPLERRRGGAGQVGQATERAVVELTLTQRFDTAQVVGVHPTEVPLSLDILSRTSAQSVDTTATTRGAGTLGVTAVGDGVFPTIGVNGNLNRGTSYGFGTDVTGNRVGLHEAGELGVLVMAPHTSRVVLRDATGVKPLSGADGHALLLLDGGQCKAAPAQQFWSVRGVAHPDVVDSAQLVAADNGDMLQRLWAALPAGARRDPAAYHQLSAFTDIRSLIADPEWLDKPHRTTIVSPAPANPTAAAEQLGLSPTDVSVEVRARVVDYQYLWSSNPVSVQIGLTTTSDGTSRGTSRGGGFGGSVGLGGPRQGAAIGATAGAGRGVVNTDSASSSLIGGTEDLGVRVGTHHSLQARVLWEAVVTERGKKPVAVPLTAGSALYTVPEHKLIALYGQDKVALPVEQTADIVERYLTDKLELSRTTATQVLHRYRLDAAGVTEGLAATHTEERLRAKLRQTSGIPVPQTEVGFDRVLEQSEALSRQPTEVALPEPYQNAMADARIDRFRMADYQTGQQADLLTRVRALVDQQSPGLLERDAAIGDSLATELEGRAWIGHRHDIWSPRGFQREYSVRMTENGPPERVRIRIRGRFVGPPTTDGTPQPPSQQSMTILQTYLYLANSQTRSRSVDYTGSLNIGGGNAFGLDNPAGGVSTHRIHGVSATNSQTLTWMSRISHPETAAVERGFMLMVDVERVPAAGTVRDRLQRLRDQPPKVTPVSAALVGDMTMLVPRDYVGASTPQELMAPATLRLADHRTASLPTNPTFISTVQPYLSGEREADYLHQALTGRLGRSDLLGPAGMAANQARIDSRVSATRLQASFGLMLSPDGLRIDDLQVPGHRRTVTATITGKVFDFDQVGPAVSGVGLGKVERSEVDSQNTLTGNRALPLSREGGAASNALGMGLTVSSGEQVTDKVSDLSGSRTERSGFIEPERVVTVRFRYSCDVEYSTKGLGKHAEPRVVDLQRNAAFGEAFITMDEKDFHAMRTQMERGETVAPPESSRPLEVRPVQASEYAPGPYGPQYQPYQPLVMALQQARREGAVVALTMHQYDGSVRQYHAMPDGTMSGENDGGFGKAFATLHPNLALLAENRVDLRALYNSPRGEESFTRSVSKELERTGVPASVIAQHAHSLPSPGAARHALPPDHHHQPDGARPRVGTTYTPGPGGPTGISV